MPFSCTDRHMVTLFAVVVHPGLGGNGGVFGQLGKTGKYILTWLRSRLDASITEKTEFSTVVFPGKFVPFQLSPGEGHVAHVGRAAMTAPRCAACVIVE